MGKRDNTLKAIFLTAVGVGAAHYGFDGADRSMVDSFSVGAAAGWGALMGDVIKTILDKRSEAGSPSENDDRPEPPEPPN